MHRSTLSASQLLLQSLSADRRSVLSLWRALIYLRRASHNLAPDERRWHRIPGTEGEVSPFLVHMQRRGDLQRLSGTRGVYQVIAPFAGAYGTDEREALFEINPYAILSHYSALVFHGLTQDFPKAITAISSHTWADSPVPMGTGPGEWSGIALPAGPRPLRVMQLLVSWKQSIVPSMIGVNIYSPTGVPYWITGMARTLIDTLQDPELSGGITNVLQAWVMARDQIDIDEIVNYTALAGITLLRQRVGYVLEELGLSHPILDAWASDANRGGSSRLVGSQPLSSVYNRRWNLSLNAPVHILHEETWI